MATLAVTFGVLANNKTISTADQTRILAAAKQRWGQVSDGAGGMRDRTNAELFDLICALFLHAGIKDLVLTAETQTARTTVPDLSIS